MKKKIIIAFSVVLVIAALITGWVFWKISKNPDKNGDISQTTQVSVSEISTDVFEQYTYIASDGDKLTYSPETKTLTVSGEEIDINISKLEKKPECSEWFADAEKIVFAEGVITNWTSFAGFEKVKTIEMCSTMQGVFKKSSPALEKYVVNKGNKFYFNDENGILYSIHSDYHADNQYVYLVDIPSNAPITEFKIPDYVDSLAGSSLKSNKHIKKVILGKGFEGEIKRGLFSSCSIECFEVDADNPKYCSDEKGVLYNKDKSVIYAIPSNVDEFVMPKNSVFAHADDKDRNDKIKKITLSNASDIDFTGIFLALEEIVVPESNTQYCSIDGVVYSKDMKELIYYPLMKKGEIFEISSSITSISSFAFKRNKMIKRLFIPDSVMIIGDGAFNYSQIEIVAIGKGLKEFEIVDAMCIRFEYENPFALCNTLKYIKVDKNNPYFCNDEQGALYTKDMKILITVPAGRVSKEFTIPDAVEVVRYSFTNCTDLEVINIGSGLETFFVYSTVDAIDFYGFKNCDSLREINVSEDNPYFESIDGILYSKGGKRLVMYPPSKKGDTFVIPDYVTEIEWKAFRLNKYIEKLYVGKNIESLENYYGSFPYFANDDNYNMMFDVYYEGEQSRIMELDETELYSVYYNSTMPQ